MVAVWVILAALAWLGLGAFVMSGLRPPRARPTPPAQPVWQEYELEVVDIRPMRERDLKPDPEPELDARWN